MPITRFLALRLLTHTLQQFHRALLGNPQDTETAFLRKDGREVPVYCTGGPLLAGGQTIGVFAVIRDISLEKRAEQLLRSSQAETEHRFQENALRYRQLFACSSDAVLVGDVSEYIFEDANPAATTLLGYSPAELAGMHVNQISAQPEQSAANRERMLAGPHPLLIRFHRVIRRKDGSTIPVDVSLGTFEVNGRVKFIGSFRDISEQLRLEREVLDIGLREQRRLGSDLDETVCRQLAAITTRCRDLADELAAQSSPGVGAARELVRLLDHSLTEARGLAHGLQPAGLQAHTLVAALTDLVRRAERVFDITCEFEHDPAPVLPDAQTALQFYLIAQEAISYAARQHQARHLQLRLSSPDHHTVLIVRDDGREDAADPTNANDLTVRIMRYRAELIGASFTAVPADSAGGHVVTCSLPITL
jgi:PAS domain S-box-containing protein